MVSGPVGRNEGILKPTNEFTINIAQIEGTRQVVGVVHAPALNLTYWGSSESLLAPERRRGPQPESPPGRWNLRSRQSVASKDHAGQLVKTMLSRLPRGRELGGWEAQLKFCLVAEGKADPYLRDLPTMKWDTAAAHCVVHEAGARFTRLEDRSTTADEPQERWHHDNRGYAIPLGGSAYLEAPEKAQAGDHRPDCGSTKPALTSAFRPRIHENFDPEIGCDWRCGSDDTASEPPRW